MTPEPAEFSTSDLNVAAYLVTIGRPLLRLEGRPGQRAFVFGDVIQEDVTRFYAGVAVDARKLLGSLRDLKGLLVQEVRR